MAPVDAPDSFELTELAEIAVPALPVAGAPTVVVVPLVTTVEAIPVPQVLWDAASPESPP
jgi:hypothetical protein